MKIKRFLCYLFSLSLIIVSAFSCFALPISANELSAEEDDQKVYSRATIEHDFSDSRIMVVMNYDVSMELNDCSVEDFPELNLKSVTDLSSSTREKASEQLEKINQAFFNRTSLENEEIVSYKHYNQVICLELEETGKDKVLEAIELIQNREDVIYAGPDYPIYIHTDVDSGRFADEDYEYYAGIRAQYDDIIQLPEAWIISSGSSSIKVGVIDTGIEGTHPALTSRIDVSLSRDLTNGTYASVNQVTDYWGHGTHVAGIIGAVAVNEESIRGVCGDVTLVSLRVFDESGCGYSSNLGLAVNYAELNNIPILNFSGGWTTYRPTQFETYFDSNIVLKNIIENYSGLLICCAGNECESNDAYEVYPSNWILPNLISVGASDLEDTRAYFSNYSDTKVDVFAPGDMILSTYPLQQCLQGINRLATSIHADDGYHVDDGTSMATPFVTGVAALMLANNPNLKPHEIKCIIMRNVDCCDPNCVNCTCSDGFICDDCEGAFKADCVSGGRLNAYKALIDSTPGHYYACDLEGTTHSVYCEYCGYEAKVEEFGYYINTGNSSTHNIFCYDCELLYSESHTFSYTNISVVSGHTATCGKCGYSGVQNHDWMLRNGVYRCLKCSVQTTIIPGGGVLSVKDEEQDE